MIFIVFYVCVWGMVVVVGRTMVFFFALIFYSFVFDCVLYVFCLVCFGFLGFLVIYC